MSSLYRIQWLVLYYTSMGEDNKQKLLRTLSMIAGLVYSELALRAISLRIFIGDLSSSYSPQDISSSLSLEVKV